MEFKRLRRGAPNVWNVPTLPQRNGGFSALPAAQQPRDVTTNAPVPGGIIPTSRFSPNSKRMIDLYPLPNFAGPGGNFSFLPPDPLDSHQFLIKGDWNLSEKHQMATSPARQQAASVPIWWAICIWTLEPRRGG